MDAEVDLVGGPFAVIESDPGVFTSLIRNLGIRGLEVVELYDIEPWAVDHINPRGLVFCFFWHKDSHRPVDYDDPAARRIWFANQLIDDACASQAILNIILNCPNVDIGEDLQKFRDETEKMSAVMKGLAISNSWLVRKAHNALARPADVRGATYAVTKATMDSQKSRSRAKRTVKSLAPAAAQSTKSTKTRRLKQTPVSNATDEAETYHFIGYVPAYGKVWELDGLKSGPLEVGELSYDNAPSSSSSVGGVSHKGWMDVVRPALRMKMKKYGGSARGDNIRFSLLALVDDQYQAAHDDLVLLKKERRGLERRLEETDPNWRREVDADVAALAAEATAAVPGLSTTFAADFGARGLQQDLAILEMPERSLDSAWRGCVKNIIPAKVRVQDEISKSIRAHTDHIKRTHDYDPFVRQFVTCLQDEGLLGSLLDEEGFSDKLVIKMPKKEQQMSKSRAEAPESD